MGRCRRETTDAEARKLIQGLGYSPPGDQHERTNACPSKDGTSPSAGTVHYGPFPTREQARPQVDPMAIEYLDSEGTDGLSLWLVLPI